MNPDQAARTWWETLDEVEAAKPAQRRHDAAAKALKAHMATNGLTTYRGIELVEGDGGERVDMELLESKDPDLVAACRRPSVRRSLKAKRRPRTRTTAAADDTEPADTAATG